MREGNSHPLPDANAALELVGDQIIKRAFDRKADDHLSDRINHMGKQEIPACRQAKHEIRNNFEIRMSQ